MGAKILDPREEPTALEQAARLLKKNQVIGMPTETVYGLAGNAFSEEALTRIFRTKDRPTFDPLIVHLSPKMLESEAGGPSEKLGLLGLIDLPSLSDEVRTSIDALAQAFWPGPLTLVLPKNPKVPDLATSGLPRVALRVPSHPVAQALIDAAGTPLAAPSANRFGRISPTSALDVRQELGDRIPLILDGGECSIGVESTVLGFLEDGTPVCLRPGGLPLEAIAELLEREVLGKEALEEAHLSGRATPEVSLQAPGMLASHYAPKKPLTLLQDPDLRLLPELQEYARETYVGETLGLLLLAEAVEPDLAQQLRQLTGRKWIVESFSKDGNLEHVARNLFRQLRALDDSQAGVLFAEIPREKTGLGFAIADRLTRAAAKRE